jgi:hypothetical protein
MNCSQFEGIVQELARESRSSLMNNERENGFAHVRVCAGCDSLLDEASALTISLRALALRDARAEAPSGIEVAVVAAYRKIHVPEPKLLRVRWRMPAALTTLAIAAALGISVFLYRPLRHLAPAQVTVSQAVAPATQHSEDVVRPDNGQTADVSRNGGARVESAQISPTPSENQALNIASASKPRSPRNAGSLEDISATSGAFMPLPYADGGPVEDATLVRMVLPGTALSALGLPVTDGSAEGKVVADFIVGEDGTPEAIRIVR